ncbi:MAG TPA: rhomboid family intramembrane serine protease [Solirubrobacteraceae bacterium]|nr:rhomboid family intramembrane serine protease [Solirubrobacteraceae bacterium]
MPAPAPSAPLRLWRSTFAEAADGIRIVVGMLALMWIVWVVNALDSYRLDRLGIEPRNLDHLYGVLTAPFLHASFGHLLGNSVPFLILGVIIALGGVRRLLTVIGVSTLISGLGVWFVASAGSFTIGASGVIFGFATYLVSRGIFSRRLMDVAVGLIVGALFGLSLLADLIPRAGVSWQGHLFGAVAGVLAASIESRRAPAGATLRRRAV